MFVAGCRSSDQAAHEGKIARRAGKGREDRIKKDCFFTSEASMLLKIKGECFANAQNELVLGH
jgi:hypothetical protein